MAAENDPIEVKYAKHIEKIAGVAVKYLRDIFAKTKNAAVVPTTEVKKHLQNTFQNVPEEQRNLMSILIKEAENRCLTGVADPEIGYDGCVYFSKKGYPDKYFYDPKKSE